VFSSILIQTPDPVNGKPAPGTADAGGHHRRQLPNMGPPIGWPLTPPAAIAEYGTRVVYFAGLRVWLKPLAAVGLAGFSMTYFRKWTPT